MRGQLVRAAAYQLGMAAGGGRGSATPSVDQAAQPCWSRTGYELFPYAARHRGRWWVLRLNRGFPEHDLYRVFIDGAPVLDVTGSAHDGRALARTIAALRPFDALAAEPTLAARTANRVVKAVAGFADYDSERGEPCALCAEGLDGMARR